MALAPTAPLERVSLGRQEAAALEHRVAMHGQPPSPRQPAETE